MSAGASGKVQSCEGLLPGSRSEGESGRLPFYLAPSSPPANATTCSDVALLGWGSASCCSCASASASRAIGSQDSQHSLSFDDELSGLSTKSRLHGLGM